MLHKIQKALSPGHDSHDKHDKHMTRDAAFDVAHDNFGQFKTLHDRMLTNSRDFLDRMKFFAQSNHVVATDLYDLYAQGGDNQFKDLAGEFHRGHEQILLRDVERLIEEARTTLLQKVDRVGSMIIGLEERIKQRSHTLSEMDDYTAKVSKLSKKEKPIEPGSKEERIEQRHQELVDTYTRLNMGLTGELVDLWTNRNKLFNPIMSDFAAIQAAFAQLLLKGARLNNASAAPGADVQVLRTTLQDALREEPIHLAQNNTPFEFGQASTPMPAGNIGSNISQGMGSNVGMGMGSGAGMGSGMGSGMVGSGMGSGMGMGSNIAPVGETFADRSSLASNQPYGTQPLAGQSLTGTHQPLSGTHQPLTGTHHQPLTGTHHQPLTGTHQPLTGTHHQPLTGTHQPLTGSHLTQPLGGSSTLDNSSVGILDRPIGGTGTGDNPQVCVVTPVGEINKDFAGQDARRERWNEF